VDHSYDSQHQRINVSELKEGMYLMHLITDGQVYTQTFIKRN